MDLITIYAIAAGGILGTLFLIRIAPSVISLSNSISVVVSKHLSNPYILNRHRLYGPWTRANVLLYVVYVAVSAFFAAYRAQSSLEVGRRAGTLSVINMGLLILATHLSLLADILGISLHACQRIHRVVGYTTTGFVAFHIVTIMLAQQEKFPINNQRNFFAILVCENPIHAIRVDHL